MALFCGRRRVEQLEVELARTQAALAEAGALDDWQRAQRRHAAEQQLARVLHEEQAARIRVGQVQQELAGLQSQVIETRTDALLQEAGVYDYTHPLDSAVAYKEHLTRLKADIKTEVTARRAVTGTVDWTVNGSRTDVELAAASSRPGGLVLAVCGHAIAPAPMVAPDGPRCLLCTAIDDAQRERR